MTVFKDIEGFPDYKVDTNGVVIRKEKKMSDRMGRKWTKKEKIIARDRLWTPYESIPQYHVRLYNPEGKIKKKRIPLLILETFEPIPVKLNYRFLNGDTEDIRLENLEWIFPYQTIDIQEQSLVGDMQNVRRFTDEEIMLILDELEYARQRTIEADLSDAYISYIANNERRKLFRPYNPKDSK